MENSITTTNGEQGGSLEQSNYPVPKSNIIIIFLKEEEVRLNVQDAQKMSNRVWRFLKTELTSMTTSTHSIICSFQKCSGMTYGPACQYVVEVGFLVVIEHPARQQDLPKM